MGFMDRLSDPDSDWTAWDYARGILDHLQAIRDQTGTDPGAPTKRIHVPFVITADASGNGQHYIKLPAGQSWELLTYGWQVTFSGGATGYVGFYRDVEEGTSLLKVDSLTQILDDSFNAQGHWIPEQSRLLVVIRGVPAGAVASGNVTATAIQNAKPTPTDHHG